MDLGLTELGVKSITKLICLGNKAFAIGYHDNENIFKIATYFTGKMPYADNRLHSILNFNVIGNTYKDFVGSEADGYVFFNVFSTDANKNQFKALNLNGPDFYAKSETKTSVNDALVGVGNTNTFAQYNLMFTFVKQKTNVYASSRTKKVKINSGKTYDIDESCLIDGPIFNMELPSTSVATITPRVNHIGETISSRYNTTVNFNYASQVSNIGDNTFMLMQSQYSSFLHVKPADQGFLPFALNLTRRCHKMHVLAGIHAASFMAFFSCLSNNQWRFYMYQVTADGQLTKQFASNIVNRSIMLDVEKGDKPDNYLLASIDDRNNLYTWYFDASIITSEPITFIQNFNYTDGNT